MKGGIGGGDRGGGVHLFFVGGGGGYLFSLMYCNSEGLVKNLAKITS